MSQTCRAITAVSPGKAEVQTVPVPRVRDGHLLVKVKAVALNPTDWKSTAMEELVGKRIGCDYAGVVEEVGRDVAKPFRKGDRVCGFVFGACVGPTLFLSWCRGAPSIEAVLDPCVARQRPTWTRRESRHSLLTMSLCTGAMRRPHSQSIPLPRQTCRSRFRTISPSKRRPRSASA